MGKKIFTGIRKRKEKFKLIKIGADMPDSISDSVPQLTVIGNNKVNIEGKCSIVEYEKNIIKISFKSGYITFYGEGFDISDFYENRIVIEGNINSIEFSC